MQNIPLLCEILITFKLKIILIIKLQTSKKNSKE